MLFEMPPDAFPLRSYLCRYALTFVIIPLLTLLFFTFIHFLYLRRYIFTFVIIPLFVPLSMIYTTFPYLYTFPYFYSFPLPSSLYPYFCHYVLIFTIFTYLCRFPLLSPLCPYFCRRALSSVSHPHRAAHIDSPSRYARNGARCFSKCRRMPSRCASACSVSTAYTSS